MRKEVLLAIVFGVILGGIILFGINLANKSVSNLQPSPKTPPEATQPAQSSPQKNLEIITPQNHLVTTEKTITLSGKVKQSNHVAIISELDDLIINTGPEGTFSAKINLVSGENTITVTSLLTDNFTDTETITVIQTNSLPE